MSCNKREREFVCVWVFMCGIFKKEREIYSKEIKVFNMVDYEFSIYLYFERMNYKMVDKVQP